MLSGLSPRAPPADFAHSRTPKALYFAMKMSVEPSESRTTSLDASPKVAEPWNVPVTTTEPSIFSAIAYVLSASVPPAF